jgi:hypothetical protein
MTDLTAFEQRLADHFGTEAPRRAPDHVTEVVMAAVRSTAQRRRWSDRLRGLGSRPAARPSVAIATAAVVVAAVGLVWLVTERPLDTAGRSPDPSALPSTAPTPSSARPPTGMATFGSSLYGFSVDYPADWLVFPATTSWDGTQSLFEPGVRYVDRLDGPGAWVLKVASREAAPGMDLAGFVASGVMDRPERFENLGRTSDLCSPSSGSVTMVAWQERWEDAMIGGRPALVRHTCGIYDGVVHVGERIYIFSLRTVALFQYKPDGPKFEDLMASVVFD